MVKLKFWAVLLAACGALSACSLLDPSGDTDASSDTVAQSATGLTPTTTPALGVEGADATLELSDKEIFSELQALYAMYGIEGIPELVDGVWFLNGVAQSEEAKTGFLGAARRVEGINVTRNLIAVGGAPDATITAEGGEEQIAASGEAAQPVASEDSSQPAALGDGTTEVAATEDVAAPAPAVPAPATPAGGETLPRTGLELTLGLMATGLIAAGAFAVATGRHLWLKAQLTNCFRILPVNPFSTPNSVFTVRPRRRRR